MERGPGIPSRVVDLVRGGVYGAYPLPASMPLDIGQHFMKTTRLLSEKRHSGDDDRFQERSCGFTRMFADLLVAQIAIVRLRSFVQILKSNAHHKRTGG